MCYFIRLLNVCYEMFWGTMGKRSKMGIDGNVELRALEKQSKDAMIAGAGY